MPVETTPLALVVGGDVSTRATLQALLAEEGYRVSESASIGAIAVSDPAEVAALIIIRDGLHTSTSRVLLALRRLGYHAPTVLLVQSLSVRLRERAFALGVVDVVTLPAERHELLVRLRVALKAPSDTPPARLNLVRPDNS